MNLENFKEEDFVGRTDIGSGGYKLYSNLNIRSSKALYLYCEINDRLSKKIDDEQKMDTLDRLLRSFSNMALNETFISPNQYFNKMIDTKNSDFLALSEHLFGRTAASMMNSEQINKVIKTKQADLQHERPKSIINEFFNENMKDQKKFVQNILGLGLR